MVNKFVDYLMALHEKMVEKIPHPIKQAKDDLEDALEEIKGQYELKKNVKKLGDSFQHMLT